MDDTDPNGLDWAEQESRDMDAIWEEEGRQYRTTGFQSMIDHFETLLWNTSEPFAAYRAALNAVHAKALEGRS